MLAVTPLPGPFGAEISDLNLNRAIDDSSFEEIIDTLHRYAVVCIRDQHHLTPKNHIAFSERLGDLEIHVQSSFNLDGYPEIYCITNCVDENGRPLGLAEAGRVGEACRSGGLAVNAFSEAGLRPQRHYEPK